MREAIGGALLIKLVMFFIAIYVAFLGIAINYAITFRVKNQVINLIESHEGYSNAEASINNYISNVGYYRTTVGNTSLVVNNSTNCINGYCVEQINTSRGNYFRVTTFVRFDFPIVGNIVTFPVTGESRIIWNL